MKLNLLILLLALSTITGLSAAASSATPSSPDKPTTPDQRALETLLIAQEKATWEAVKRHDAAAFANLCLENEYEIFGDGSLVSIQEAIAEMPDTEILEYVIEDMQVIHATQDTALVRYRILAKVSYKGEIAPPQWMLASAVWVKTPQGWKAAMYQETPLPKK